METPLRFLADESCDHAVVRELRRADFDVLSVAEGQAGVSDRDVIAVAAREHRILITEDKDFGWLVYSNGMASDGVILIRYPTSIREALAQTMLSLIIENGDKLRNAFVVVQPGHIRIERLPDQK